MPLRTLPDARPLGLRRILYGGDYHPEPWPDEVRDEDALLMNRAHWNVATLPVFGWVHLNPAEGVFTFEWLDRVVERLTAAGVDLCLATATASTPAWVDQQYPDVLTVDDRGRRAPHGNRHAFCPSSPSFRRLGGALVRAIAERYGKHPGLRLWHVNDEYAGHWPSYCHCARCIEGFRAFLERRYGSLAALNAAWSTAFWGHTYTAFGQIEPPFANGECSIQALKIDWRRFQSSNYLACCEHEAAILREVTPHVPITTNFMGAFFPLDYHRWAPGLDVASWDNYPRPDTPFTDVAFSHALTRGMRDGQPFLLMEQTPSQQSGAEYCRLKPPGRLRLQSYQAIAHGAESIMYYQWRRSRGGIEKLHGAVVEHHGRADSRVFGEVAALGEELAKLGARTLGGRTPARVALVFDWESWWALAASSGPTRDLDYLREAQHVYAALVTSGIQTDVIGPEADLARYDVIVLPTTYVVRAAQAEHLAARVRSGATLVATFFTGVCDENDQVHPGGPPGPLREVLGITVEEFDALPPTVSQGVRFEGAATEVGASLLCERVWVHEEARVLARHTREFYAGDAAITIHAYGEGEGYYVATRLASDALGSLLRAICTRRGIVSPLGEGAAPPEGVEVTVRTSAEGPPLLYLLHHGDATREIPLPPGTHRDLLSGRQLSGVVSLEPRQVMILEAYAP